jgi:hypothetical protein
MQTFSYTADERRERVGQGGAKTEQHTTRQVIIRRPNALAVTGKRDGGDIRAWYDGKQLTLVSDRDKVWARGPMPATLDEALDFLADEYALQLPTADLLYTSPYDALMTKDTTGGWVDVQKIGDLSCDHLVYKQEVVDWEIWLGPKRQLPCQMKITYKKEPGLPSTIVTYHSLETPPVTDDTFTAKVPADYRRLRIMRHATVNDPKVDEAAPVPAAATPKPRK